MTLPPRRFRPYREFQMGRARALAAAERRVFWSGGGGGGHPVVVGSVPAAKAACCETAWALTAPRIAFVPSHRGADLNYNELLNLKDD